MKDGAGGGDGIRVTPKTANGLAWQCAVFAVLSAITGGLAATLHWWVLVGLAVVGVVLHSLMAAEFWRIADKLAAGANTKEGK